MVEMNEDAQLSSGALSWYYKTGYICVNNFQVNRISSDSQILNYFENFIRQSMHVPLLGNVTNLPYCEEFRISQNFMKQK